MFRRVVLATVTMFFQQWTGVDSTEHAVTQRDTDHAQVSMPFFIMRLKFSRASVYQATRHRSLLLVSLALLCGSRLSLLVLEALDAAQ